MQRFELVLATAALVALPVIGVGSVVAWLAGPYANQRSLSAIQSAAPEIAPEGDYVSSRDCRSCHPDTYRTWHASYHRQMTQLATPEAVVADFDDVELSWHIPPSAPGGAREERYRLSEREGEYWMTWINPDPDQPDLDTRIVMTTGSHTNQILWISNGEDGRLISLPWTYVIEAERWVPRSDAFLSPPDDPFGLSYWSDVCIECHSTQGRPRIGEAAQNDDSQVAELGIACESCHGPAGLHISTNRPPWRRYSKRGLEDPSIVNPARLTARRTSYVCGRCHSVLSHSTKDDWGGHWNDFVPGDDLESDGRMLIIPNRRSPRQRQVINNHERALGGRFMRERFWSDGAVRVAGRELTDILTSPCFKGNEFSCLSCHSLHDYESPADQLAKGRTGDAACVQCHSAYQGDMSSHTRHASESAGSRCANCHTPYTTYGLQKAIRSHRVSSPSIASELATGRPNACNTCHLDRSLAWTQDQLARDYGIARVRLDETAHQTPSGPRWIATGDAGVRALAAWYMGWEPARQAAGSEWMAPYLAELLADPYAAVRGLGYRSLVTLRGYGDLDYDFVMATGATGIAARTRVQAQWVQRPSAQPAPTPGPLVAKDRTLDHESWARLVSARDTRPISLSE